MTSRAPLGFSKVAGALEHSSLSKLWARDNARRDPPAETGPFGMGQTVSNGALVQGCGRIWHSGFRGLCQHRFFRGLFPARMPREFVIARHSFVAEQRRNSKASEGQQDSDSCSSCRRGFPQEPSCERKQQKPGRKREISGSGPSHRRMRKHDSHHRACDET